MTHDLVVVAGGGGFIGGHLVGRLLREGHTRIRSVDLKPMSEWHQRFDQVENLQRDLRTREACLEVCRGAREVYTLAADMGGMGFIEANKALCMLSVLVNTHMLLAAQEAGAERYFFASSACVYPAYRQNTTEAAPLREQDTYPAMPEDGYGWEKLFGERMCRHFREDFGLQTRVARYHNVYGPHGAWTGGREKAPAAICRKVIQATLSGSSEIEIWGDGTQVRSFMYIDDCLEGTLRLVRSDFGDPINIGSSESVSVDGLVDIVEAIAGVRLVRKYKTDAPKGVNGRNSDNTLVRQVLGWEPSIRLVDGLTKTYAWIHDQMLGSR